MTVHAEEITDFVVGGVTIAFACLALFVLIPLGVEDPGAIDVLALGPAFWPSIISVLLLAMGVIICVQAFRRARAGHGPEHEAGPGFAPGRWLTSLALLAGLYAGLHALGMLLTSVIALVLFMLLGGERRPLVLVAVSLLLPAALYVFFRYVANVVIPLGVLEPWLA